MEAELLWWWSFDVVQLRESLTHSFVSNSSGDDFIPIDGTSWWCVIIFIQTFIYLWLMILVIIVCIELWLILGVYLMKLLYIFLMLVLGMDYLDWFVKKEKYTGTFGLYFSCFEPFGFEALEKLIGLSMKNARKLSRIYGIFSQVYNQLLC